MPKWLALTIAMIVMFCVGWLLSLWLGWWGMLISCPTGYLVGMAITNHYYWKEHR